MRLIGVRIFEHLLCRVAWPQRRTYRCHRGVSRYLGRALQAHDIQVEIIRIPWGIRGWPNALRDLECQAEQRHGVVVLIQYTALAWSSRGFPWRVLQVMKALKSVGVRVGIVFHDVEPYVGSDWLILSAAIFKSER